jgi:hypothetical protein
VARFNLARDRAALVAALIAPLAISAILVPWRSSISNTNVALILVVVVVAVAAIGNRVAGMVAALSAAVWFDFFFTQPYQRFTITSRTDVETTVLLLVVGVAVSQLAARARRLKIVTILDAGYLAQIHDAAQLAQSANSPRIVVDHVKAQLVALLELRESRFEYGSLTGHPPHLERDGTILRGGKEWDADRLGLPAEEVELRVIHNGRYYGRFMLAGTPGTVPPLQARLVAVTLADQVSTAFANTSAGHE